MKIFKRLIIPFCAIVVYILAIVFIPVIAKSNRDTPDRQSVYSENIIDENTINKISGNSFIMYIDYESDKLDYYNNYKNLEIKLYLSIYSMDDLSNFNKDIFDGIFIKDIENKDEIISTITTNYKTNIRLLTNDLNDYSKYKKEVETFIFTSDTIEQAAKENKKEYFYKYLEISEDDIDSEWLNYLKDTKGKDYSYGFLMYIVK